MSISFRGSRNVELSLLKYLEDSFASDWSNVSVVKLFKNVYAKEVTLPVICARLVETSTTRLEIGSTTLDNRYLLAIDIFATSDAQRMDLADYLKDKVKNGWVHYNHSHASGNPKELERVANGRDFITEFITDSKMDFGDSASEKDRYRQNMTFLVRKSS